MEMSRANLRELRRDEAERRYEQLVAARVLHPGLLEARELFVAGYLTGRGYGFEEPEKDQGGCHARVVEESQ